MNTILQDALSKVNQEYFAFTNLPHIKLSKGIDKIGRKAIVFGTYHLKKNEIKIHPILIKNDIPRFVLNFVIYHEMLHYQDRHLLSKRKKGDPIHTSLFKQREKQFKEYQESKIILKKILYGHNMNTKETHESAEHPLELNHQKNNNKTKEKLIKNNRQRLTGEKLEQALAESLQHLENVLIKHNMIDDRTVKRRKS